MTRQVTFKRRAELDVLEAREWYEEQRVGLGDEFVVEFDATLAEVCSKPANHKEVSPGYRRATTKRFPYLVVFRFDEEQVVVIGGYHSSRSPRRWKERIKKDREDPQHE
jgi:plasmid stabilization system protein ParE